MGNPWNEVETSDEEIYEHDRRSNPNSLYWERATREEKIDFCQRHHRRGEGVVWKWKFYGGDGIEDQYARIYIHPKGSSISFKTGEVFDTDDEDEVTYPTDMRGILWDYHWNPSTRQWFYRSKRVYQRERDERRKRRERMSHMGDRLQESPSPADQDEDDNM